MIERAERESMLAVALCGERVVKRLESIGVQGLSDLKQRDPWDLMHEVNLEAGREIWHAPLAIEALENLVEAARREGSLPPAWPSSRA